MISIPAADPHANYRAHADEIDQAIRRVLDAGRYILGPEVAAFESEFAGYLGAGFSVGVASGTDALHLALRVLGIGPGDSVVTVSHTAVATVAAIELAGATPVLADINPATYTLDVNSLERAIRQAHRPRAVIPVHLYGHPADMPAILDVANRHGLHVVEDCAQSHGAALGGRKTGTFGCLAAFSFYPTKNLGALGDGGALVTDDPGLAARARQLREYGWQERYVSEDAGMNSRLDELQAAILRVKLRYLDEENARRRHLAALYGTLLQNFGLALPISRDGACHVYHQFVVRCSHRDDLRAFLQSRGIGTAIHYPQPVHQQPAYRNRLLLDEKGLAATELACAQILSLPMHAQLTEEQVRQVSKIILARQRLDEWPA